MRASDIGDPRLQELFGPEAAAAAGVKPIVRVSRDGPSGWVIAAFALGTALLLFWILESRREAEPEPQVRPRGETAIFSPEPPPLYIPPAPVVPPPPSTELQPASQPDVAPSPRAARPPLTAPLTYAPPALAPLSRVTSPYVSAPRPSGGPALVIDTTGPGKAADQIGGASAAGGASPYSKTLRAGTGSRTATAAIAGAAAAAGAPGFHYVRAAVGTSIGAKRNLACEAAKGAAIVHWDDDDWYAPDRVSRQVAPILAGLADVTGLENRYVLELPGGQFWTVGEALHRRMFVGDVHGGTLAYARRFFDGGCRYPAINLAEDAAFLRLALRAGARLARLPNDGVFVYVRHGENAWRFRVGQFLDRDGWTNVARPPRFPEEGVQMYRAILGG